MFQPRVGLTTQPLNPCLAAHAAHLPSEVDWLVQEIQVLREDLDDVRDKGGEGGIGVRGEAVEGGEEPDLAVEHADADLKLPKGSGGEAIEEDFAEEELALPADDAERLGVGGEEANDESNSCSGEVKFNFQYN